jgi:Lon protease-like protein
MPKLPLFPLNLVVYPGEVLNLHIFEPRYRQLIGECLTERTTFGIPTHMEGSLPGYGCEMEVSELVKRYEDGRMDIRTCGLRVFNLLDFENPAPGKLYAQGDVDLHETPEVHPPVEPMLIEYVIRLYKLLSAPLKADPDKAQPYSYQIAHGVGLPVEGEYKVLTMETEKERQDFLLEHLAQTLPVLEDIERTRARIRMNGHFQEMGPLKF